MTSENIRTFCKVKIRVTQGLQHDLDNIFLCKDKEVKSQREAKEVRLTGGGSGEMCHSTRTGGKRS